MRDAIVGGAERRRALPLRRLLNAAMSLPAVLSRLRLPVIGSPLFIISNPKLVMRSARRHRRLDARAQCAPAEQLDDWLAEITETLAARPRPPGSPSRAVCHQPDRPQEQ